MKGLSFIDEVLGLRRKVRTNVGIIIAELTIEIIVWHQCEEIVSEHLEVPGNWHYRMPLFK